MSTDSSLSPTPTTAAKQPIHIAVFGSLRKNSARGYNHNRCGSQRYISTHRVKGWSLYPVGSGSYPAICPHPTDELTVELHEVDEKTKARIDALEFGAGYKAAIIDVGGTPATIYFMSAERFAGKPKVESGDWN